MRAAMHRRLFFERSDLVVEHPLRSRPLATGVVDRGHFGAIAQRRDDERVVGDRGTDDDRHTLRDEILEAGDDLVLAPSGQTARVACDELERTVEAPSTRRPRRCRAAARPRTCRRPAGSRRANRRGPETHRWPSSEPIPGRVLRCCGTSSDDSPATSCTRRGTASCTTEPWDRATGARAISTRSVRAASSPSRRR